MEIKYARTGKVIKNYNPDWISCYPKGKDEHSAWEFGKFIFNDNGIGEINKVIARVLGQDVVFERACIEKGVKFDDFKRPSMRDMVIEGKTVSGKSLFITIEAKVDEDFGRTIGAEYSCIDTEKYRSEHPDSQKAERMRNLYKMLIGTYENIDKSQLRYQLFHTIAATAAAEADYRVMMIVEIKKNQKKSSLERNNKHFIEFMKAIKAEKCVDDISFDAVVSGRNIKCIYIEV